MILHALQILGVCVLKVWAVKICSLQGGIRRKLRNRSKKSIESRITLANTVVVFSIISAVPLSQRKRLPQIARAG